MLIIGRSLIQGKGLFTDIPLRARKKIGEFSGEPISIREARKRSKNAKRIAIVEVSDTVALDGTRRGGPFSFINHSCDSNVFIRIAFGRAEFYAKKNIRAGDELTCDYVDSHHDGKLPCRCGSSKCRKFI